MLSQGPADVPQQRELSGSKLGLMWCVTACILIPPSDVSVQDYIDPGAGLKHLEDWFQDSDFIFDSLFMNSNGPVGSTGVNPDIYAAGSPTHAVPMARSYQGEAAMYFNTRPPLPCKGPYR